MDSRFNAEEALAIRQELESLAQKASEVLMAYFGNVSGIKKKADESIVTDADLAAEKVILGHITAQHPEDAIISEESHNPRLGEIKDGQRVWIIDPLDGTSNFANHYPFFSVSIGLAVKEAGRLVPVAGCVAEPVHSNYYSAVIGHGTTKNGYVVSVRKSRTFESNFLVTGFYYHRGSELQADLRQFETIAEECQTIRRDGSAALDLAYVAAGIYDAFWERGLNPWDLAAGVVLVSEAGGSVFNYTGPEQDGFDLWGEGVIAGTELTAEKIRALINA